MAPHKHTRTAGVETEDGEFFMLGVYHGYDGADSFPAALPRLAVASGYARLSPRSRRACFWRESSTRRTCVLFAGVRSEEEIGACQGKLVKVVGTKNDSSPPNPDDEGDILAAITPYIAEIRSITVIDELRAR